MGYAAAGRDPFGVVTGFIASFVVFTLSLSAIVQATGISPEIPRYVAVVILVAFGLVMIVPTLRDRFELWSSDFVSRFEGLRAPPNPAEDGMAGPMAASMATDAGSASRCKPDRPQGLTRFRLRQRHRHGSGVGHRVDPRVGPIMASVIGLAAANKVDARAVVITVAYAVERPFPC